MDGQAIKLTDEFSIAPGAKDPNSYTLYDGYGGWRDVPINEEATFRDSDDYAVKVDAQTRTITLTNTTKDQIQSYKF